MKGSTKSSAKGPPVGRRIRVLLADDHAVVRKGISMLLNAEPALEVVGEASDGLEAVALTEQLLPTWWSWTSVCPN